MELQPFYIGQKVVAIKDHCDVFKKGEKFTIIGIVKSLCTCNYWRVEIDKPLNSKYTPNRSYCPQCKLEYSGVWYAATSFAPIITDFQSITFEKVLEEELVSVN